MGKTYTDSTSLWKWTLAEYVSRFDLTFPFLEILFDKTIANRSLWTDRLSIRYSVSWPNDSTRFDAATAAAHASIPSPAIDIQVDVRSCLESLSTSSRSSERVERRRLLLERVLRLLSGFHDAPWREAPGWLQKSNAAFERCYTTVHPELPGKFEVRDSRNFVLVAAESHVGALKYWRQAPDAFTKVIDHLCLVCSKAVEHWPPPFSDKEEQWKKQSTKSG